MPLLANLPNRNTDTSRAAPTLLYLHGFASSPGGTKAEFIRAQCEARGLTFRAPDLNVPDFECLTMTAMLDCVAGEVRACPNGPVCLIGSSLGGHVAVNFLHQFAEAARVTRLVLMAPALTQGIAGPIYQHAEQWARDGSLEVFHHAYHETRRLHYGFVTDMAQYPDPQTFDLSLPMLIFHGVHDTVVPPELSVRFARSRDNVILHLLESDHSLWDAQPFMWAAMEDFFGL